MSSDENRTSALIGNQVSAHCPVFLTWVELTTHIVVGAA
ncbi:hypothetical protein GA0115261_106445 [Streptomyces sp. OspMP-M43]|nr:hypothetical protein GA0115261_106445 [Streptomyces sp. OspMP-M43]